MKPVYVACFCARGDLLSQWRGYADPGGYAVGFDAAALQQCVAEDRTCTGLRKVEYEQGPVGGMVERVAAGFPDLPPLPRPQGSAVGLEGWLMANRFVLTELASIKDPAFQEEVEWRIIAGVPEPPETVRFRAAATGIVGYRTIDIASAIREAIVGPGKDEDSRELGVRRLIQPLDIGDQIRVHRSTVPYRTLT